MNNKTLTVDVPGPIMRCRGYRRRRHDALGASIRGMYTFVSKYRNLVLVVICKNNMRRIPYSRAQDRALQRSARAHVGTAR